MSSSPMPPHWIESLDYIKRTGGVTFAEMMNRGDTFGWMFGGDVSIEMPKLNVVLWSGLSKEGGEFFSDKRVNSQIVETPTPAMIYFFDGCALTLPVANRVPANGYKKTRWLPVEYGRREKSE